MSRPMLIAALACALAAPASANAVDLKLRALLNAGNVVSATESYAKGEARASWRPEKQWARAIWWRKRGLENALGVGAAQRGWLGLKAAIVTVCRSHQRNIGNRLAGRAELRMANHRVR